MVKNSNFCRTFVPSCRNLWAKVDGSMPECAQVCAIHMRSQSTALGDAKENKRQTAEFLFLIVSEIYGRKVSKW